MMSDTPELDALMGGESKDVELPDQPTVLVEGFGIATGEVGDGRAIVALDVKADGVPMIGFEPAQAVRVGLALMLAAKSLGASGIVTAADLAGECDCPACKTLPGKPITMEI